ncbi:MAG: hypothetical protein SGPRY_001589 [Prymnesium sp.]
MDDLARHVLSQLEDHPPAAPGLALHICIKGWQHAGCSAGYKWVNYYAVLKVRFNSSMPLYDLYFQTEGGAISPTISFGPSRVHEIVLVFLQTWMETRPVEHVATRVMHLVDANSPSPLNAVPVVTFFLNENDRSLIKRSMLLDRFSA